MTSLRVARRTGLKGTGPVLIVAFTILLHTPVSVKGQVVRGEVVDATTERGVPAAEISLMGADGAIVSSVETDSAGAFLIGVTDPGEYRLEVQRIGYERVATDLLELPADSVVYLIIRLATDAVPLEPVEVIGRQGSHQNRATFQGLYERRARAPSVGSNRVWVRGDPELDQAMTVREFLRLHGPRGRPGPVPLPGEGASHRHGCVPGILYRGTEIRPSLAAFVLDLRVYELEGIEVYRDLTSAPPAVRPTASRCGFAVIWPRRRGNEPW